MLILPKFIRSYSVSRKRRAFKKGQLIEVDISDMAFGGKGIGKVVTEDGEFVIFVLNTIPGQKVLARVVKCKNRYAECKLDKVLVHSADETTSSFQTIPGAPYAKLPIKIQENYKKSTTLELFKRIGKVENIEDKLDSFISSPETWHYRNKMEYSFSVIRYDLDEEKEYDDFGLGFKHRGTWWCVENMDKDSGLFDEDFENNLHQIRKFCEKSGFPAWHPPKREGFFRHLVVRKSYYSNELLINLITSSDEVHKFDIDGFLELLKEILGTRLAGLFHTLNDDTGDRTIGVNLKERLVYGKEKVVEQILGLDFEISMQSFFQTNPKSAEKLYSKVADYALENNSIGEGDVVMDLFCGTGTIGQILASKTENTKIIGVDIVPEAIVDAKRNAERNNVAGLEFYAADVGKFLIQYPQYKGKISCIVLDPPRAGIAPKTLNKVIDIKAKKIVYVSCNPATQARDTEILNEAGYKLSKFSLVDQFPHTSHIETIAVFEK